MGDIDGAIRGFEILSEAQVDEIYGQNNNIKAIKQGVHQVLTGIFDVAKIPVIC